MYETVFLRPLRGLGCGTRYGAAQTHASLEGQDCPCEAPVVECIDSISALLGIPDGSAPEEALASPGILQMCLGAIQDLEKHVADATFNRMFNAAAKRKCRPTAELTADQEAVR